MHKLKSDIIHALQSVPMSTDKLVEVSNICDAYAKLNESMPCEIGVYDEPCKLGYPCKCKHGCLIKRTAYIS